MVLVKLKSDARYSLKKDAQLINQLKTAHKKVGMIINFGRDDVEFKTFGPKSALRPVK